MTTFATKVSFWPGARFCSCVNSTLYCPTASPASHFLAASEFVVGSEYEYDSTEFSAVLTCPITCVVRVRSMTASLSARPWTAG